LQGYRYNSDSLYLYDFASALHLKGNLLDVGIGCGIIGLLLARDFTRISLYGVEKQAMYYTLSQQNARCAKIDAKITHCDFLTYTCSETFDTIVSNPPFYIDGRAKSSDDSIQIARYADALPIDAMIKKVVSLLKQQGDFIFCYEPQALMQVMSLLEQNSFKVVRLRFVHAKINRRASLVLIHARLHSRAQTQLMPPLIAMQGNAFSAEVQAIYDRANTYTIGCQL